MPPIEGWRRYWLKNDEVSPVLSGMWEVWPGPVMQAECLYRQAHKIRKDRLYETATNRRQLAAHHISGEDKGPHYGSSGCGIYILPEWEGMVERVTMLGSAREAVAVDAYCRGWGIVAVMELGWRCQYVEMLELWATKDIGMAVLEDLQDRYRVPIVVGKPG